MIYIDTRDIFPIYVNGMAAIKLPQFTLDLTIQEAEEYLIVTGWLNPVKSMTQPLEPHTF